MSQHPTHDDSTPPILDGGEWTRTTAALRRVARSVGASPADAEDAAQGALLACLGEEARGKAPGVGWLKALVRHRTIDRLRQRSRREVSLSEDTATARAAVGPGPPGLAVQFEIQRAVMSAVEELPEPYRETVFLRYFEELSVPEIAERNGAPVPTVRTWLTRGHARLRERLLDSDHTYSPGWIAAFFEFGRGHGGGAVAASSAPVGALSTRSISTAPFTAAALIMSFKTLLASAVVIAVVGFSYVALSGGLENQGPDSLAKDAGVEEPASGLVTADVRDSPGRKLAKRTEQEPPEVEFSPAAQPETIRFHGQVLDGTGKPFQSLRVRLDPPLPGLDSMITDSGGGVEGQTTVTEDTNSKLVPEDGDLTVLFWRPVTEWWLESGRGALVAVSPSGELMGTVRGTEGEAVIGATIQLQLPEGFRSNFNVTLATASFNQWETISNASGLFEIGGAPLLEGCSLSVTAEGYKSKVVEGVPVEEMAVTLESLEVILEPVDPSQLVGGVVLDPGGEPVAKAYVSLGASVLRTDARGRFKFQLDKDANASKGPRRLVATANGWCPVEFAPGVGADGEPAWPEYTELRLQEASLSIEGVVLDRGGEPAAGHSVWAEDMTAMGLDRDNFPSVTEALGYPIQGLHSRYKTDDRGRFRMEHLSPKDYRLVAMDPDTLEKSLTEEVAAGDDSAVLRYDPKALPLVLAGRVMDRRGEPVEGATLRWRRYAMWVSAPGTQSSMVDVVMTEPVLTGADGSFRFQGAVPDDALVVLVSGEGYSALDVVFTDLGVPLDNTIFTLGASCQAKVFAAAANDADRAKSVVFLDQGGKKLELRSSPELGQSIRSTTMHLVDGVSVPFSIADTAVQAVFYGEDHEVVGSQTVSLVPGELNEIRQ